MKLISDNSLLRKARKFDLQALSEIYDRYSPELYRYAYRLCGDEATAEDCVSESFNRLLVQLQKNKGPQEHLRAYLYRTAHNWMTDLFRKNAVPLQELSDEIQIVSQQTEPSKEVEQDEQANEIRKALFKLTTEQRQVIVLRYMEGWKQKDIAVLLDKPIGAAVCVNDLRQLISKFSVDWLSRNRSK
nr:sigma-70 family RNA polymerase sigma factor [Anaerolineaceae bacterium]